MYQCRTSAVHAARTARPASTHRQAQLSVVGVLVLRNDVSDGTHVHCKQHRAKNRPLRHSDVKSNSIRAVTSHLHVLCAVAQVGAQPVQCCVDYAEPRLQALDECRVVDGVKCSGQIKSDKNGDLLVVICRIDAVEDFQQCSLCRVPGPVGGLVLAEVHRGESCGRSS